ncbi:MAG: hypothetical protein II872_03195 [Clostridia bacterium]|jgi:hypothetical protein|nr:hypothetical protein [Clostridia bacterium]
MKKKIAQEVANAAEAKTAVPALPKRKRRFGDRPDGYRLRSLQPMSKVSPYIMPNRSGASVYFHESIEITEAENYIRKKRNQGLKGFGMMHLLLAAYVRVVSQRPQINRFLSGQRVYTHYDDIIVNLTIKRELTLDAEETIIKMHFSPSDTAEDIYRKLQKEIDENREVNPDSGFDNTAKILNFIPGLMLKNAVWLLKMFDYFGWLPKKLLDVSPFHGSMFITSMGSLGIPPVYHHLYDFGNLPIFLSFGAKYKKTELKEDGTPVQRKYIDYKIVCDERICDGFTLASSFKMFKTFFRNPHVLDEAPETVHRDVD